MMNTVEMILSKVAYEDGQTILEHIKDRLETAFRECVEITHSEVVEKFEDGFQLWVGWIDNHGLTHGDEMYIPNNNQ